MRGRPEIPDRQQEWTVDARGPVSTRTAGPMRNPTAGRARYGELLIRAAQRAGREVLLAPPRPARAFLRAQQPRAKTDRVDRAGLALDGLGGRLRPYRLPSVAVDQVRQRLTARRGLSQSLTALEQRKAALPYAGRALAPAIKALHAELAALDRQIREHVAQASDLAPVARLLRTIPGVGATTSAALAACLVDKQFTHPDQFVAYLGLDIEVQQSSAAIQCSNPVQQSGRRRGRATLTKQGDAELRRLLFLAALSATRASDGQVLASRYVREQEKGLAKTAALNAVARKLAKIAWSLVAHNAVYDPARVDTQPCSMNILDSQP